MLVICALPVIRWFMLEPMVDRFGSPVSTLLSLGQISGIVGLTLFAFNLLLTTRIKLFEDLFGGLNRVFIAHHIIGTFAFVALLMHPLMLALRLAPSSLHDAGLLFVPRTDNLPVALGIVALAGLTGLMVSTFFVKLTYRTWLLSHKFLGGVFFLAGLHALLTPNDLSADPWLRFYLVGFSALGLVSYVYRTMFPGIFVKRYAYTVSIAKQLNDSTVEVSLIPKQRAIRYDAGQFVFVSFRAEGLSKEWHPFTVSSAPSETGLAVTVKSLGSYTNMLSRFLPSMKGIEVLVEGAYGRFTFNRMNRQTQVWIAGGIGITPFLAMAKNLSAMPEYDVDLYYAVAKESELVDVDALKLVESRVPGKSFRLIPYVADKQGLLTAQKIAETSGNLDQKDILLCGPPPMMTAIKKQLSQLGVHPRNIHSEEFRMS